MRPRPSRGSIAWGVAGCRGSPRQIRSGAERSGSDSRHTLGHTRLGNEGGRMPYDLSLDRRGLLGAGLALSAAAVLPARAAEVTPRIRRLAPGLDRIVDANAQ